MPEIAETLRGCIKGCGLSLNEIARQVDIPQPTLTTFMQGKDIRVRTAEKLAKYFGLELAPRRPLKNKKV